MTKNDFDKVAYRKQKEEELKRKTNKAVRQVLDFKDDPSKVFETLDFMAHSTQHSFKNQMMIQSQYPNAGFLKGKRQFEEALGVKVMPNEKPIKIVAPHYQTFVKRGDKNVLYRFATKEEKAKVKKKEIPVIKKLHYYKLVDVYDITQTYAKASDYPEYYPNKREDFYSKDPHIGKDIISANQKLLDMHNIKYDLNSLDNQLMGTKKGMAIHYQDGTKEVKVNGRLSDNERMKTLLHETTHALYHRGDKDISRSQKEMEAELTAYVVSKHFGVDTKEYSIRYVSKWTEELTKIEDIEQSMNRISEFSSEIIEGIEEHIDQEKIKVFYKENEGINKNSEVKTEGNYKVKETEEKSITIDHKERFYRVTEDEIALARKESVLDVAYNCGVQLEKINENLYVDREHQHIKFFKNTNTYFNQELKKGGNGIDYCINEQKKSFPQSVKFCNEIEKPFSFESEINSRQKVTDEEVRYAEKRDMVEVAESCGYTFQKVGKNYVRSLEHDSLNINLSKNTYHWYSKDEYGNPINFIQKEKDLSFKEAVKYLNEAELSKAEIVGKTTEAYTYDEGNFVEKDKMNASIQYLTETRAIDQSLVEQLIQQNSIKQDKRNNTVFIWKDYQNNITGAEKVGTGQTKFKGIEAGSDVQNSFNFELGDSKNIYIFESPIDAMSYASIHRKSGMYVSMSGLKEQAVAGAIYNYVKKHEDYPERVHLCVDNDDKGEKFANKYPEKISNQNGQDIQIVRDMPHDITECKDWNDVLKKSKDSTIENFKLVPEKQDSLGVEKTL